METRKEKLIAFSCIFFISILSYINFITGYFSIDTENIISLGYKGYAINYFLYDGRIFSALFALIGELTNISLKNLYIFSTICSIAISSVSVILLYKIVYKILKPETKIKKFLLILLSYTYIFHFMSINNFEFFENCIMSIGILLYILAAQKIVIERKILLGTILCILATAMYQGTINSFLTTAILFLFLKKKTKKEFWKGIGIILVVTLIAGGINVAMVGIAKSNINTTQATRINLDIIKNIRYNLVKLPNLFLNSLCLFPKYLHITFILIELIFILIYCIRRKDMKHILNALFLIGVAYLSCISLSAIYPTCIYDGNGRIFASVGASFSVLGIYILCNMDIFKDKKQRLFFITLITTYSLVIICNTIYMTNQIKEQNRIDERFSKQMIEEIEQYEKETGVKIKSFAILYYEEANKIDKKQSSGINNKSKIKNCLYTATALKVYTGKELEYEGFDEEVEKEYFSKDENKMLCIGDKLYIKQSY